MKHPARRPHEGERGAVLVETALVSGIILTFLLFSIQIGILGFLQVTADAASFVGARVATLSTASPGPYTASVFDQIKSTDVSSAAPQPAPTATVPVDYNYNNPAKAANAQYNRDGGFSEIQPELDKVSVTPSKVLNVGGNLITVSGADTEPLWNECGAHFNVAGTTTACGSASNPAVSYFNQGENTPTYYVGFNEIKHCEASMPWGAPVQPFPYVTLQASGGSDQRGVCPSATEFLGLGIGEQLDFYDWQPTSRPLPGAGSVTDTTFGEAACHQRTFVAIANFMTTYPTLDQIYYHFYPSLVAQFGTNASTFTNWKGFEEGPTGQPDTQGQAMDAAIDQAYQWDVIIQGGEPLNSPVGAYPTTPAVGCS